jgi:hypothetical protein
MNNQSPDEKWKNQVNKLKEMYPSLEEDDFTYDYGMKDVMLNRLQDKLGKNREELNEMLAAIPSE